MLLLYYKARRHGYTWPTSWEDSAQTLALEVFWHHFCKMGVNGKCLLEVVDAKGGYTSYQIQGITYFFLPAL